MFHLLEVRWGGERKGSWDGVSGAQARENGTSLDGWGEKITIPGSVSDFPNYFRSIISCGLMFPFSKLTPSSVALLSRSFWYMFYSLSHISPWIWSPRAPVRSDSSLQQIWHSRISLSLHRLIFSLLVHFFLLLFLLPVSNLVFSPPVWLYLCLPSLWASDLLQKEKGSFWCCWFEGRLHAICVSAVIMCSVIFPNVKIRGVLSDFALWSIVIILYG